VARRGLELTRDRAALAIALTVHAAVFLCVRTLGVHSDRAPTPPAIALADEVELDLSAEAASVLVPAPGATTGRATDGSANPRHAPGTERRRAATSEPPPSVATLDHVSPPEAEPPPTPGAVASGDKPVDLGIGPDGWQRWVTQQQPAARAAREPRAPLVRAPPVSSTGGLQEGLEARDRELGIGPAGRVASALYQAAHGDAAPVVGVARFNVTVLRSGAVEISLGSANDAAWRVVAEKAAEELRRSPPRIPPPRDGYRLTLKITAEEVMPNGTRRSELHGPKLEVDPPRLRVLKEEQKELELKNPTLGVGSPQPEIRGSPIIAELPGIYVTEHGKVCKYRLGLSVLGPIFQGGCDLVNVGAKLQRIVRTEVEKQSAF
jgi:hypothetical protein